MFPWNPESALRSLREAVGDSWLARLIESGQKIMVTLQRYGDSAEVLDPTPTAWEVVLPLSRELTWCVNGQSRKAGTAPGTGRSSSLAVEETLWVDSALDSPEVRLTQVHVLPRETLGKLPGCTCSFCLRALGL